MCGLFGFDGERADPRRLALVAQLASRRGPHAMGVAWESGGHLRAARVPAPDGAAFARLLSDCADSPRIIGQFRLATSGDWRQPHNNQPILIGDVAVAHNGNIPDWRARAAGVPMETECDSELIAHWVRNPGKGLQLQLTQAMRPLPVPFAVLALRPGALAWCQSGLPLYEWWCEEGVYFCSLDPKAGPWYAPPGEHR
jgi:glutamine phosphoribosylpyrophosphate amidotransferase